MGMESSGADCLSESASTESPRTPVVSSPVSPSSVVDSPTKSNTLSPAEYLARCRRACEEARRVSKSKHDTSSHGEVLKKVGKKTESRKSRRLARVMQILGAK